MKQVKLYNVIFPIWVIMFFPPIILITMIGNFIIDSLVVIICFYAFKLANEQRKLGSFYMHSIWKVWIFGFIADIIGAVFLFTIGLLDDFQFMNLPNDLINGIFYDPFSDPLAVLVILISILISGAFIFLFNYKLIFREQIEDQKLRLKVALTIAIVTMPWTFLVPTKWFYQGF